MHRIHDWNATTRRCRVP